MVRESSRILVLRNSSAVDFTLNECIRKVGQLLRAPTTLDRRCQSHPVRQREPPTTGGIE